ncbi:hypothetical protein J6590_009825 [Homalodisca vitripennis]|nr:hypothetical protein J6590_009825 [Homalodisca vitripennis]
MYEYITIEIPNNLKVRHSGQEVNDTGAEELQVDIDHCDGGGGEGMYKTTPWASHVSLVQGLNVLLSSHPCSDRHRAQETVFSVESQEKKCNDRLQQKSWRPRHFLQRSGNPSDSKHSFLLWESSLPLDPCTVPVDSRDTWRSTGQRTTQARLAWLTLYGPRHSARYYNAETSSHPAAAKAVPAASQFSTSTVHSPLAGANCAFGLKALDQLRQIKADKKAEEVTKAARVAARIKKRELEDMEEEEELYGPGIDAVV